MTKKTRRSSGTRTTAAQFSWFRDEVGRCIHRWELSDWDVDTGHRACERQATAVCAMTPERHRATIYLNLMGDPTMAEAEVRQAARHEVAHIITAAIYHAAMSRFVTEEEVTRALEATTIRLSRILP